MLTLDQKHRPRVWKGLVAGVAGGLAGTFVMSQFQKGWEKASKALQAEQNDKSVEGDTQSHHDS